MTSRVGANNVASGSETVQESLSAQRTVASLSLEEHFYDIFVEKNAESKGWVSAAPIPQPRSLFP